MTIEIVDLPMENGDFPLSYVSHYQRVWFYGDVPGGWFMSHICCPHENLQRKGEGIGLWGAAHGTAHALGTLRHVVWVSNAWLACGYPDWGPIIKQQFAVKIWEGFHVTCFCSTKKGCVVVCFVILHDIFLKFFPKETDDEKTRVCFQVISQVLVRHGSSFMACR